MGLIYRHHGIAVIADISEKDAGTSLRSPPRSMKRVLSLTCRRRLSIPNVLNNVLERPGLAAYSQQALLRVEQSSQLPPLPSPQTKKQYRSFEKNSSRNAGFASPKKSSSVYQDGRASPMKRGRQQSPGPSSSSTSKSHKSSRATTPKRGSKRRAHSPVLKNFIEGPFHDAAFIKENYHTSNKPLLTKDEATPKNVLHNFSTTAAGKAPEYESTEGTFVKEGGQRVCAWRFDFLLRLHLDFLANKKPGRL